MSFVRTFDKDFRNMKVYLKLAIKQCIKKDLTFNHEDMREFYEKNNQELLSSVFSGGGPQGCTIFSIMLNLTLALVSFSAIEIRFNRSK